MKFEDMNENYKLAKWLSGEMTKEELAAFQAEPDFAVYEKIKLYSSELESPKLDEAAMIARITAQPKKAVKTISLYQNLVFKAAAVVVVAFGLLFTYQTFSSTTELADNGKQQTFLLPDNSEVVLNSGSEASFKKWNWNNNRIINLTGEAYFKVAKGKRFEVKTTLGKVTVLGTHFNVKQRDNRFDVTCYEGRVKVNYQNREVIITKGMSVAFKKGQSIAIPENVVEQPEWLTNELVFYQEDLKSVLNEFERHFNVHLELKTQDNSQLFTGTIPAENIDVALQVLSTSYHLEPIKVSTNKFILKALDAQK